MTRTRPDGRRCRPGLVAALAVAACALPGPGRGAAGDAPLPIRPDWILGSAVLRTPALAPFSFCEGVPLPEVWAPALEPVAENPGAALARVREALPEGRRGGALLAAALAARSALTREERVQALAELDAQRVHRAVPEPLLLCAELEWSRLALAIGRHPEAASSARRAALQAARANLGSDLQNRASLLRAEALYLAGRGEEAAPIYRRLLAARDARVAGAAALRRFDLAFDRGRLGPADLTRYIAQIEPASSFGASQHDWALRVAELAIEAGDLDTAKRWLTARVREDDERRDAIGWIRLADVAAARGRSEESREMLLDLAERHDGSALGTLAGFRLLDLEIERTAAAEAERSLVEGIAAAEHPGLVAYGRTLLGRLRLAGDDVDGALPPLLRATHDASSPAMAHHARQLLDRALASAAAEAERDEDCPTLVRRIGGIHALLLAGAHDAEPFVRLGSCLEQVALPGVALELYQRLARTFGPDVTARLAFPVARASLAAGHVDAARAAAVERVDSRRDSAEWRLLLAEIRMGEPDGASAAAELIRSVASRWGSPAVTPRSWLTLARAANDAPPSAATRALLFESLRNRTAGSDAEALDLTEAAVLAARLHLQARETTRAQALYETALSLDPAPAQQAEAAYWLGRLAGRRGDALTEQAARVEPPAPYARLARSQQALDALRLQIGRLAEGAP